MPRSRDDERVEEARAHQKSAEEGGASSGCADELTREAEDLGMYWGTGCIATWCAKGECVTKPKESGYCEACEEAIEVLKQAVRGAYDENDG